jgi:hypothetical protein
MQLTRTRAAIGALTIALGTAGVIVVDAGGQAAAPPTGTLEFDVVNQTSGATAGANPAGGPRQRFPRIADLMAGNGKVVIDGRSAGRWDTITVTTDRGNGRGGGDAGGIAQGIVTIGQDALVLGGARVSYHDRADVTGPITGGTGRYAGARGVAVSRVTQSTPRTLRQHFVLTFMP